MFGLFRKRTGADIHGLHKAIESGALLVDVRTPAEYQSGSVPGAINIPLDKIVTQLNRLKGGQNIIVFCRSGSRSGYAQSLLEHHGFSNVINGGSWQNVRDAAGAS